MSRSYTQDCKRGIGDMIWSVYGWKRRLVILHDSYSNRFFADDRRPIDIFNFIRPVELKVFFEDPDRNRFFLHRNNLDVVCEIVCV